MDSDLVGFRLKVSVEEATSNRLELDAVGTRASDVVRRTSFRGREAQVSRVRLSTFPRLRDLTLYSRMRVGLPEACE